MKTSTIEVGELVFTLSAAGVKCSYPESIRAQRQQRHQSAMPRPATASSARMPDMALCRPPRKGDLMHDMGHAPGMSMCESARMHGARSADVPLASGVSA